MKILNYILTSSLLSSLVLVSCDYNAGKPEYQAEAGYYDGTMAVGLYTPDYNVEQSCQQTDGNYLLCTDSLNTGIIIALDNENWMGFIMDTADTICFDLPFLELNGQVRSIFKDGYIANLYDALKLATLEGYCTKDTLMGFQHMIRTLHDTIVISDITIPDVETEEFGNAITSYNHEQKSFYTKFELYDTEFSRSNNLIVALRYIQPVLTRLKKIGKLTDEQIRILESIATRKEDSNISNGAGYCMASIASYHLRLEVHLEQASGLLDEFAKALYGVNDNGDPNKDLWVTFYYEGDYDVQKNVDNLEMITND